MEANWASFTEQETAEILQAAGGFDADASGQMYVGQHPQMGFMDYIEEVEGQGRDTELISDGYILATREHALQMMLTDASTQCEKYEKEKGDSKQARLTLKEQARLRKSAAVMLDLLGADDDGNLGPGSRVLAGRQFTGVFSDNRSDTINEFSTTLLRIMRNDFDLSPIGFLDQSSERIELSEHRSVEISKPVKRPLSIEDEMTRIETIHLCEIWQGIFCRQLKTSVDPITNKAGGKLVSFIHAVEKRWRPSSSLTFEAVRDRVRRIAHTKGR